MCGEVIFRGEECVSLGWCFWHRACYGCLLCGSQDIYQGKTLVDLFDTDAEGGREVEIPPLCAYCAVEAEVDEVDEEATLRKGMQRVERYDCGLSEARSQKAKRAAELTAQEVCARLVPDHDRKRLTDSI